MIQQVQKLQERIETLEEEIRPLRADADDLVKRLRKNVMCGDAVIEEAASRIEKLEAALREIAEGPRDVDKSYLSLFHEIQSEARKALEENK